MCARFLPISIYVLAHARPHRSPLRFAQTFKILVSWASCDGPAESEVVLACVSVVAIVLRRAQRSTVQRSAAPSVRRLLTRANKPAHANQLIGESGVGKSSVLLRYTEDVFSDQAVSNIGVVR